MPASRDLFVNLIERKTGNAFAEAANDMDRLAGHTDKASRNVRMFTSDTHRLNESIKVTRRNISDLYREFARTGDRSIFGDINKEEANLRRLERTAARLFSAGATGGGGLASFAKSADFSQGVSEMRGIIITALIGAAVAAAPTVGAMIAGGVAGAIGTVGVGGGIAMAAKDPAVQAAARRFGKEISEEFFSGGSAFVGPVIQSLNILEDAFKDLQLPAAFAKMAPHVTTIAEGLGDLARNIMPGLNKAFERMGPFAAVAADGFAEMGEAFSMFLDDVTRQQGAVAGLESLFDLVNGLIIVTGKALAILSGFYLHWLRIQEGIFKAAAFVGFTTLNKNLEDSANFMADWTRGTIENMERGAGAFDVASGAIQTFGVKADLAAIASSHLSAALDETHTKFLDWIGAEIGVESALDNLQDALRTSGGSIDVHNEKSRDARQRLLDFAEAARVAAAKKYAETGSIKEANKVYEHYRAELIKTFMEEGRTRKEAEKLANAWLALAKMPNLNKTVTLHVRTQATAGARYLMSGATADLLGLQHGGWSPGGNRPFVVGEKGPEIMSTSKPMYVTPNSAMDGTHTVPPPAPSRPTVVEFRFTGSTDSAFATAFQKLVRNGQIVISVN